MSAAAEWVPGDGHPTPSTGRRCRYCRRVLAANPSSPHQERPHCGRSGCLWCHECATGQTRVSPVRPRPESDPR